MATSGPGATNLVTGIANAYLDSIPMVAITGQVPTPVIGTDAFQEVDTIGITLPVVKHSFALRDADDIADVTREAFYLARSGRPGPVLIDLPKDVALAATSRRYTPAEPEPVVDADLAALDQARALLRESQRPVLYVGGGVVLGDAVAEFRAFAEQFGAPVVVTLKALGALPSDDPLSLGMLGMHGSKAANLAVQRADLLVVVGARFDDRVTGELAWCEAEVWEAMCRLAIDDHVVAEGAGAVAAAALHKLAIPRAVAVISGGNVDGHVLGQATARGAAPNFAAGQAH